MDLIFAICKLLNAILSFVNAEPWTGKIIDLKTRTLGFFVCRVCSQIISLRLEILCWFNLCCTSVHTTDSEPFQAFPSNSECRKLKYLCSTNTTRAQSVWNDDNKWKPRLSAMCNQAKSSSVLLSPSIGWLWGCQNQTISRTELKLISKTNKHNRRINKKHWVKTLKFKWWIESDLKVHLRVYAGMNKKCVQLFVLIRREIISRELNHLRNGSLIW